MSWTTIPAFLISAILYTVLSPSIQTMKTDVISSYKEILVELNFVHWYAIIPLIVLIVCTLFKILLFSRSRLVRLQLLLSRRCIYR